MKGFTLLEVMVALMILAISLTAIFRAVYEDNHIAMYLKEKNSAHEVGKYLFNKYQLQYLYPINPSQKALGQFDGYLQMLKKKWYWVINLEKSSEANLLKITISVHPKREAPPANVIEGFLLINETA